jgi:hypothetical protein
MTMITEQTESRILEIVRERGSIVLEDLLSCLPESTWNQVFTSVDGLSRQGTIRLRRRRFDYELLAPSPSPAGVCEAADPASGLRPAAI